jgi:GLPGLI family protein
MKNFITTLAGLLLLSSNLFAQHTHFTTSGTIEFEKRVNMYAVIQRTINSDNDAVNTPLFENYKKSQPQFKTLKSTLSFSDNKTLFVPDEEATTASSMFFSNIPATHQSNVIYSDLTGKTAVSQRSVLEERFLVKDTLRKIKWKITDETREIAGYTCRRANAIVADSIYVVAFYTTKIRVPGGPESFHGLPGMILGVALPHENITWFATKVTEATLPPNTIVPPKKGKTLDEKAFREMLLNASKDWGKVGKSYIKIFLL